MFRLRNSLVVHERPHTQEKPHRCLVCDVSFKRSHHLTSHLKTATHKSRAMYLPQVKQSAAVSVLEEADIGSKSGMPGSESQPETILAINLDRNFLGSKKFAIHEVDGQHLLVAVEDSNSTDKS